MTPEPITREDMYYDYLINGEGTLPKPITRKEQYLYYLCTNGFGVGGGGEAGTTIDHTYSFEGRRVGTWLDEKPLYEKTVDFGSLPNATTKGVPHGIENVDMIWIHDGFVYNPLQTNADVLALSYPPTTSSVSGFYFKINPSKITCVSAIDRSHMSATIIARYTKTTD